MNHASTEEYLLSHGVKPTAVRLLVWERLSRLRRTFSLADVEEWLPEMDRSSVFRALRLFTEHHLLHEINDGTGHQKYCVCRCHDDHHLNHVHFTCLLCGRTYCLENCRIPRVCLPEGYEMKEAEYVVKGVCPSCRQE